MFLWRNKKTFFFSDTPWYLEPWKSLNEVRDWMHLVDFLPYFTKEITFLTSSLVSYMTPPKMKEFSPRGSKFLSLNYE